MKKLLLLALSLSLLTACSFLGGEKAPDVVENDTVVVEEVVEEAPVDIEAADAEVEALIDEEAVLDKELDALEDEGI